MAAVAAGRHPAAPPPQARRGETGPGRCGRGGPGQPREENRRLPWLGAPWWAARECCAPGCCKYSSRRAAWLKRRWGGERASGLAAAAAAAASGRGACVTTSAAAAVRPGLKCRAETPLLPALPTGAAAKRGLPAAPPGSRTSQSWLVGAPTWDTPMPSAAAAAKEGWAPALLRLPRLDRRRSRRRCIAAAADCRSGGDRSRWAA